MAWLLRGWAGWSTQSWLVAISRMTGLFGMQADGASNNCSSQWRGMDVCLRAQQQRLWMNRLNCSSCHCQASVHVVSRLFHCLRRSLTCEAVSYIRRTERFRSLQAILQVVIGPGSRRTAPLRSPAGLNIHYCAASGTVEVPPPALARAIVLLSAISLHSLSTTITSTLRETPLSHHAIAIAFI